MDMYDEDRGYYSSHLWIPKRAGMNLSPLKNSLTYSVASGIRTFEAWEDCGTHIKVPRETIPFGDYPTLPFEVVDCSPHSFHSPKIFLLNRLRDYQIPAFEAMMSVGNGIISLACGRGKTVIAIHAIAAQAVPAFVVVPSVDLAYQWKTRIIEHTDLDESEIGWAQGAVDKWVWSGKPITIGIINSVATAVKENAMPPEMRMFWGCWVYDECHRLGAELFNYAAAAGFGRRWGLSATPYRGDGNESLFKSHIGDVIFTDLTQPNIPDIRFLRTDISLTQAEEGALSVRGELNLSKSITYLSEMPRRRKMVVDILTSLKKVRKNILVLTERTAEAFYFNQLFKGSGLIVGSVKGADREKELQKDLVFATSKIAREGLDKSGLNTILILHPFTDKGRFVQIVGRAQRGKDPVVYILQDSVGPMIGMCKKLRRLSNIVGYPHRTYSAEDNYLEGIAGRAYG